MKNFAYLLFTCLIFTACSSGGGNAGNQNGTTRPGTIDIGTEREHLQGKYHTILPGETILRVARKYGVSVTDIMKHNPHFEITAMSIGTKVFIPGVFTPTGVNPINFDIVDEQVEDQDFNTGPIIPGDPGVYQWPIKGKVLTRYKQFVDGYQSRGILISAKSNSLLRSPKKGEVILATDHFGNLGKCVIIDHGDIWTIIGNLSTYHVKQNTKVKQGQVLAKSGYTSKGQGYYLCVRQSGKYLNPLDLLP